PPRQAELTAEHLLLHVARREVVVVVEPDLAERDGALRDEIGLQPAHRRIEVARVFGGLVGVNADRESHLVPGRFDRLRPLRLPIVTGSQNHQCPGQARGARRRRRPDHWRTLRRRDGSESRSSLSCAWGPTPKRCSLTLARPPAGCCSAAMGWLAVFVSILCCAWGPTPARCALTLARPPAASGPPLVSGNRMARNSAPVSIPLLL